MFGALPSPAELGKGERPFSAYPPSTVVSTCSPRLIVSFQ